MVVVVVLVAVYYFSILLHSHFWEVVVCGGVVWCVVVCGVWYSHLILSRVT